MHYALPTELLIELYETLPIELILLPRDLNDNDNLCGTAGVGPPAIQQVPGSISAAGQICS